MKTTRDLNGMTDRYAFDMGQCSMSNGFAQVDTTQDAPYFGIWANPFSFIVITYAEGDITTEECASKEEFIELLGTVKEFYEFKGIDCGWTHNKIDTKFEDLGLKDLLH